jgi:protein TonB
MPKLSFILISAFLHVGVFAALGGFRSSAPRAPALAGGGGGGGSPFPMEVGIEAPRGEAPREIVLDPLPPPLPPAPVEAPAPAPDPEPPEVAAARPVEEPPAPEASAARPEEKPPAERPGSGDAPPGGGVGFGTALPALHDPGALRPVYPARCRRLGHEGIVVVRALILEDGTPKDPQVLVSSRCPDLDRAAVCAVRAARFAPALRWGKPIAAMVEQPVRFELRRRG